MGRLSLLQRIGRTSRGQEREAAVSSAGPGSHVRRCWPEWEISGRERSIVLCVETDLELQPEVMGFNADLIEELLDEATRLMRKSASPIDRIRVVPSRRS